MSEAFPRLLERETSCGSLVFSRLCFRGDAGGWPSQRSLDVCHTANVTALLSRVFEFLERTFLRMFVCRIDWESFCAEPIGGPEDGFEPQR